jgi:DNA-binding transcriptional ArsR family regulator
VPSARWKLLTKALGNSPKLRILDYLLDYKLNDFTIKEILEAVGMSKLTFYKYFKDLEELGLVIPSRKIGRATLYKINLENPMVKMMIEYETKLSLQIAEQEEQKMKKAYNGETLKASKKTSALSFFSLRFIQNKN